MKLGSAWNGDDLGVITHSSSVTGSTTTHTGYNYAWWSSAKETSVSIAGQTNGLATYSYDINGNLTGIVDTAVNRTLTYSTNSFGQVLKRQETNLLVIGGGQRNFVLLSGQVVGDFGNDRQVNDAGASTMYLNNGSFDTCQPSPIINLVTLGFFCRAFDSQFSCAVVILAPRLSSYRHTGSLGELAKSEGVRDSREPYWVIPR